MGKKEKTGLVPRRGTSPVLSSDFLYGPLELHKQQHQTDAQQDVSDPGHAGNGRVHTGGKRSFEHLSYAPHNKHDSRQVQADVIDHKNKKLQLQYGDYLITLHLSCFGKTK